MEKKKILSLAAAGVLLSSGALYGYEEGNVTNQYNVLFGTNAGSSLDGTGKNNVFIGYNSGRDTTGGDYNTFIGHESGYWNTTGNDNTFSGSYSGYWNTTGSENTFSGRGSGLSNTTGYDNTFSGYASGFENTTGSENTFSGFESGFSNVSGGSNVFSGYQSGYSNISSWYNVFMGYQSGYSNIDANDNVFIGEKSGFNSTGPNNVFIGAFSGYTSNEVSSNVFIGYESGYSNTDGGLNVFIGEKSGFNADVSNSVFLGNKAGFYADRNNTLYISNNDTNDSLIYGEFDTGVVKINGDLNTTGVITTDLVVNNSRIGEAALALSRENSGGHSDVGFTLENKTDGGGFKWAFQTAFQVEGFSANKIGTGGYEFTVANPTDDFNNVELAAAGKVFFTDGHLVNPSSRAYKDDIKTLDTKTALEAFEKLEAVTFVYKEHKDDQVVGFIACNKGKKRYRPDRDRCSVDQCIG